MKVETITNGARTRWGWTALLVVVLILMSASAGAQNGELEAKSRAERLLSGGTPIPTSFDDPRVRFDGADPSARVPAQELRPEHDLGRGHNFLGPLGASEQLWVVGTTLDGIDGETSLGFELNQRSAETSASGTPHRMNGDYRLTAEVDHGLLREIVVQRYQVGTADRPAQYRTVARFVDPSASVFSEGCNANGTLCGRAELTPSSGRTETALEFHVDLAAFGGSGTAFESLTTTSDQDVARLVLRNHDDGGTCVPEATHVGLGQPNPVCTANDVEITEIIATPDAVSACSEPGGSVMLDISVRLVLNADTRYDPGIFIGTEGQSQVFGERAFEGQCSVYTLPSVDDPPLTWDVDGDMCGDFDSDGGHPIGPSGEPEAVVDLGSVEVKCVDTTGDGLIDIPACTTWFQNNTLTCAPSGPGGEIVLGDIYPGTKSKCRCESLDSGIALPAFVRVKKEVELPANDLLTADDGKFDLYVDGVIPDGGDDAVDGSMTDFVAIPISVVGGAPVPEQVSIHELAGNTDTDLNDYSTTVTCVDANDDPISDATGEITDRDATSVAFDVTAGDEATCTFTNTRKVGDLTFKKVVVNDNGGTKEPEDFTATIEGLANQSFPNDTFMGGADDEMSDFTVSLPVGDYDIGEVMPLPAGYEFESLVCGTTTVTEDASMLPAEVSVPAAGLSCTITNIDVPATLTVKKTVTNDHNGSLGPADFPIVVKQGTNTITADPAPVTSPDGTMITYTYSDLDIGTYTVEETQQSGYSFTGFSGDCTDPNPGDDDDIASVTLALGDSKNCVLANDDDPAKLTIVKEVTNAFGGDKDADDFVLRLDGTALVVADGTLSADGTTMTWVVNNLSAGTYAVTEDTPPAGYVFDAFASDCADDMNGDLSAGQLELGNGDEKTCTVKNKDTPSSLKVTKSVVGVVTADPDPDAGDNDDMFTVTLHEAGVTDPVGTFTFDVNGGMHTFTGLKAGVVYTVGEIAGANTNLSDYVTTIACDGAMVSTITLPFPPAAAPADVKACTVTNTKKGMVEIEKLTNGVADGTKVWNFTLTGPGVDTSGQTGGGSNAIDFGGVKLLPGETYTLCEIDLPVGFNPTWSLDGVEVTPFDPGTEGQKDLCYEFTVGAGETASFGIDNIQGLRWWPTHHRLLEELEHVHQRKPGGDCREEWRRRGRLLPARRLHRSGLAALHW